ncbi:MAG: YhfC family intramembrane metalloprotease [Opitutae bacterium]|nr:YhfC family intramembrane metalloprotease [Opitutae bacterium]
MDYLVYFLGPLLLGLAGAKILRQRFTVFLLGFGAFFVAWVVMTILAAIATKGFGLAEGSFLYALFVSLSAGFCEESARYVIFRRCGAFQGNRNGRASTMYALGHHGMETVIVGLTLALIYAVVKYLPAAISDPAVLKQCKAALALGAGAKMYNAGERLTVGLFMHACFSGVVMLCFVRSQIRWLFVAMSWHFLHDMVGFNLHRLSQHWLAPKAWIAIIIIGYACLFVRLYRVLNQPCAKTSAAAAV